MKILITICARGGSKGIPGKNIKMLNKKPLIGYSIETAQEFSKQMVSDIVLSTDSNSIKRVAEDFGLTTNYERPSALAEDTSGKIDAIKDVLLYQEQLNNCKYDFIIDLDVTSPLRTVEDIKIAFKQLQENEEALNVFSVSPANRNPYFNMVEEGKDGYVHLVKKVEVFKSRQMAPKVFDMNASFYIYRRTFFDLEIPTTISHKSLAYEVPHLCFDLDHAHEFTIMELLLRENLLDFEL